jgi:hypothetical protein
MIRPSDALGVEPVSLRPIVRALGGDLYAGGRRANVPAPGHSPHDRSVSLLLQDGRVVVHTFNGTDWRAVLADLRARGLVDAVGAPAGGGGLGGDARGDPSRPARLAAARRLWREARAIDGTLSARHARLRGIARALPDALRHHPAAPLAVYTPCRHARPALVAAIIGPGGELQAVELTYLAANGGRAIGLRLPRKTVGLVPPGSAVRLDPPGVELLVGEGVFTTLSASALFGLPGWALTSTRNLRAWSPPDGVRRVLIAADRGRDGERSAEILRGRLARAGLTAAVRLPPPPHGDWNEAAQAGRVVGAKVWREGGEGRAFG